MYYLESGSLKLIFGCLMTSSENIANITYRDMFFFFFLSEPFFMCLKYVFLLNLSTAVHNSQRFCAFIPVCFWGHAIFSVFLPYNLTVCF